jgi:hypothetical protein
MLEEAPENTYFELREGVCFDPNEVTLEGCYRDQLSLYRAKRVWKLALEGNFLLESEHDFTIVAASNVGEMRYLLKCNFLTACGRYAFWRLTHNQAPEAQNLIETAHIPDGEAKALALAAAGDMVSQQREASAFFSGNTSLLQLRRSSYTDLCSSIKGRIKSFVETHTQLFKEKIVTLFSGVWRR